MKTDYGSMGPTERRWFQAVAAALTVGVVSAAILVGGEQAPGAGEPEPLVMPNLRGLETIDAYSTMVDSGLEWVEDRADDETFADLSVLHRDVETYDWRVVRTVPAAGTEIEPGQDVVAFALPDDEFAFYRRHDTMPRPGMQAGERPILHTESPLASMGELVEYRFAQGTEPPSALRTRTWPPRTAPLPRFLDPSVEPRAERQRRAALAEADDADLFVGTIPRVGAPLRPGRMIVILVRPRPEAPPLPAGPDGDSGDSDIYIYPPDDDDDDDFNVPGWLCPTRFC